VARGRTAYDDARPQWLRKESFAMLMREGDERLAELATSFDAATAELVLTPPGGAPCRANLQTPDGRARIAEAVNAFLGPRPDGPVRVVAAGELSLTDVPENCLSLVNLASVADFEARIGRPVHPLRFRGNLYLGGCEPWAELGWVGTEIGIGEVTLRIEARIRRCAATRVNPETARRDLDTLRLLKEHYGHLDMGVYAAVGRGGRLAVGDPVRAEPVAAPSSAGGAALGRARFYAKNAFVLVRAWLRDAR
jgi:uncharacterized protein YcbX